MKLGRGKSLSESDAEFLARGNPPSVRGPNCPETEDLHALVAGELTEDDERRLTLHLDVCRVCQRVIDSDIVSLEFAQNARDRLGRSTESSQAISINADTLEPEAIERDTEFIRGLLSDDRYQIVDKGLKETMLPADDTSPGFLGVVKQTSKNSRKRSPDNGAPAKTHPYRDVAHWFEPPDNPKHIGRLGQYQILDFIGRGGMGVVFKGHDTSLERTVAIKVLSPTMLADESSVERFIREAQTSAAINHVNVVTIHAVEDEFEIPFLVMEYVEGETLQDRVARKGQLEPKEIARIGYQMSSAIAAAHEKNVIHRDLKPANMLLDSQNRRLKITDFGLAHVSGLTTLTQTGYLVGTPSFVAPEAVNHEEIDHRSDLFSVGSVLYTIAAGRLPFNGSTPGATLNQIANGQAEPLDSIDPDLPDWIVAVVNKLHERNPDDRYQSAAELVKFFGQVLRQYQKPGEPVTLPPTTDEFKYLPERTESDDEPTAIIDSTMTWINKYPGQVAAISAIVVLVALLGYGIFANLNSSDQSTPTPVANPSGQENPTQPGGISSLVKDQDFDANNGEFAVTESHVNESDSEPDAPGEGTPTAELPFVVVYEDGTRDLHEDLESAVEDSDNDSTIWIQSNDRFRVNAMHIEDKAVRIIAGKTLRPIIDYIPDDEEHPRGLFTVVRAKLELVGVEINIGPDEDLDDEECLAIEAHSSTLHIENCRIVAEGESSCLTTDESRDVKIINSELLTVGGFGIAWGPHHNQRLLIENCLFAGFSMIELQHPAKHLKIDLRRNTVVSGHVIRFPYDQPEEFDAKISGLLPEFRFQVVAQQNLFETFESVLGQAGSPDCSKEAFLSAFTWDGRANVFGGPFVTTINEDGDDIEPDWSPASLSSWSSWENTKESESEATDLLHINVTDDDWDHLSENPRLILLEHFQIVREDNASRVEAGADLDRVGPANRAKL